MPAKLSAPSDYIRKNSVSPVSWGQAMFPSVFLPVRASTPAFLTMAFACGMNAPIINPLDQGIKDAFINAKLLLGFDKGAANFIAETAKMPAACRKG